MGDMGGTGERSRQVSVLTNEDSEALIPLFPWTPVPEMVSNLEPVP